MILSTFSSKHMKTFRKVIVVKKASIVDKKQSLCETV